MRPAPERTCDERTDHKENPLCTVEKTLGSAPFRVGPNDSDVAWRSLSHECVERRVVRRRNDCLARLSGTCLVRSQAIGVDLEDAVDLQLPVVFAVHFRQA